MVSFELMKTSTWQGRKFRVGLRRIKKLFEQEDFLVKLAASQYFREYGLTNLQEFFSVAVENYFETPKPGKVQTRWIWHTVQKGETLWKLYEKYGIRVEMIQRINGLKSKFIRPGQKLKLMVLVEN